MTEEPDWDDKAHEFIANTFGQPVHEGFLAKMLREAYALGKSHSPDWLPIADAPRDEDVLVVTDRGEQSVDRYETDPGIGPGWPISVIKYIPLPPPPEPKQ